MCASRGLSATMIRSKGSPKGIICVRLLYVTYKFCPPNSNPIANSITSLTCLSFQLFILLTTPSFKEKGKTNKLNRLVYG